MFFKNGKYKVLYFSGCGVIDMVETLPVVPTIKPLASALSNNGKPALTGTGAIGSLITIMDGNKILGTTTVGSDGNWSYTPTAVLADGAHQLAVKASSSATSKVFSAATTAVTYTVDTKPPAAPVISTKASLTNNDKISLAGTAEAGATIKVMDGITLVATVVADNKGAWSYAPTASYTDGAHNFTATATDAAGNVSPASAALALTVDATAPNAPTVSTASLLTNNLKPVLTGTAEAKSTVKIYDNGTAIGTAVVDATGKWTFTPSTALSEGSHAITVRASDAAGNMSVSSTPLNVVTTSKIMAAWGASEILAGQDGKTMSIRDRASDLAGDKIWAEMIAPTADFTNAGVIKANIVLLPQDRIGSLALTEAVTIKNVSINNRLNFGAKAFVFPNTDSTNHTFNGSLIWFDASDPLNSTIMLQKFTFNDFTASKDPGQVTLVDQPEAIADIFDASHGTNSTLAWDTTDKEIYFQWDQMVPDGSGFVINTIIFDINGSIISGPSTTDTVFSPSTRWSSRYDSLGNLDVVTIDASADTPIFNIWRTAPNQNVSNYTFTPNFTKNNLANTGWSFNWNYTNREANGNYLTVEFAVEGIRDGKYYMDFYQTDTDFKLLNTSSLQLNSAIKPAGRIQTMTMANGAYDIFYYQDGTTVHLTALDSKGAIIQDFTQSVPAGTVIDQIRSMGDGRFEVTLINKGPTGSNSYGVSVSSQIIDTRTAALNISGGSGLIAGTNFADTIAMTADNAVVEGGAGADKLSATGKNSTLSYEHSIAGVQIDLGKKTAAGGDAIGDTISGFVNVVGSQFNDVLIGNTNANKFTGGSGNDTIIGGGGADSVIYSGNKSDYSITLNQDGSYSVKDNRDGSPDGTDSVSAVSMLVFQDAAFATIDPSKAPVITSKLTLTNNALSAITGTAVAGSTVAIFEGNVVVGTTTADAKGNWVATPLTRLTEGSHSLIAKIVDSGGNTSLASNSLVFTVDTIASTKPIFALDVSSDSGMSATDKITNVKTPKVTGTAEVGSTVILLEGTTVLGTATVATGSTGGAFSIASGTLANGQHVLNVQAKDAAGNVSTLSDALTITIDTLAPDVPLLPVLDSASDTGVSATDGITKIATPVLKGTAEAGSKVELFDGTKSVGFATAGVDGKYSITTTTLLDGVHKLTVKATDLAGNTSVASAILTVTTDTVGPSVPVLTTKTSAVNTNAPTIAGTGEANAIVKITDDKNALYGTVIADATGKWSFTVSKLLADGDYKFIAEAQDVAGNSSAKSAPVTITVDTVAPNKPTSLSLLAESDTGLSNTDGITKVNTPTVTGKAEAGSTVTLYEGTAVIGKAVTGSDGNFSIISSKLIDGNHVLTASTVDAAGNGSTYSDPLNISVITTLPDTAVITTSGVSTTATPTIVGTAKPLTTVTVFDGITALGTAAVDMKGAWSFIVPVTASLKDGTHSLTATASDTAGNTSKASVAAALLINTGPIEVTIDQLSKYAGSSNVVGFKVKDTAANIALNIDKLAATETLVQIIQTDSPKTIDITATQYKNDSTVFTKIKSNYGLTVSAAAIADADILQKDSHVLSFQILDTVANIKLNFDSLNNQIDNWNNLNQNAPILIKDAGNIAVTVAQYLANTNIEKKLPATTGYEIIDIQADAAALSLSKNANIKVINVADTVAAITADLDKLNAAVNIKSIAFTDAIPSALVINYPQLVADAAALAKLPITYKLIVKDVPANQIATVSANTHVVGMSVNDSTANLLSLINSDTKGIGGTIADPKISTITIDETKPSSSSTTSTIPVVGISIADAMKIAALPNLSAVPSFKILDTAANIIAHARYDILNVIQHSSKITISDLPPKLTVTDAKLLNDFSAFKITNATMLVDGSAGGSVTIASGILTPIASGAGGTYTLTSGAISGMVTAAGRAGSFTITSGTLLQAGKTITLSGGTMTLMPPSHVDANGNPLITGFNYTLSDANTFLLDAANADLVKAAKTVTAVHTYKVAEALQLQAPVLLTSPFAIQDSAANIIAQSKVTSDTLISRAAFVIVEDSTSNVGGAIDDLETLAKKGLITDIKLTDTGVTPTLSATQLSTDYDAIGRIIGLNLSTTSPLVAYPAPTISAPDLTKNAKPTITGTAKPGATITLYDGTTKIPNATITADLTGQWSYTFPTALAEGLHTFTATASAMGGTQTSPASAPALTTIDVTAPTAPTLTVPAASKNTLPTISGSAEKGSTVAILDGGILVATVTASLFDKWTYTFTTPLTNGDHSLTVVATDKAGNKGVASTPMILTVDTIAPTAPTLTIALGAGSDAKKPVISGTAEKGSTVSVYDGAETLLGVATASATDGTWSLTLTSGLAIGAHSIKATAKDGVGNISVVSSVVPWTVPDPSPPPVVTSLKWTADQLKGYEFSASTGSKTVSAPSVTETLSLVAGATYTFAAGYGYAYSGAAPTVSMKILDSSSKVVGSSTTPYNNYTFTAASTGVYTVQLSATNATNTAILTSYNLTAHQTMSSLPTKSGDTNVDALLMGGTGQWWHTAGTVPAISTAVNDSIHTGLNSLTAASAKHTLTYSFLTTLPAGSSPADSAGFAAMTAVQQTAVKKALDYISTLIDVKFTLATTAGQGDINFGQNVQSSSAGYANLPYQGGGHPSYLMLASNASTNSDFSLGSYGWETLIHEIGHTLGLKHPGNYNAGGGGTPGPYLPTETDTRRYTIMSYNDPTDSTNVTSKSVTGGTSYSWTSINPQSYMLYDIEALQYLYGSNESTAYQTISFAADYKGMQTIWAPMGGKIDASSMTYSNIIDLREGYFSSIGIQGPSNLPSNIASYQTYTGMNNVAIAYGSKLNDAVGGSGNDAFYVNAANDVIDGGAGTDTVYLAGSASDWKIEGASGNQTATNLKTGAVDALKNIEKIDYYDPSVTSPTHTAPSGMLSESVSAFLQSVAAMTPQNSSVTILPSNDGMMLQSVVTLTQPV